MRQVSPKGELSFTFGGDFTKLSPILFERYVASYYSEHCVEARVKQVGVFVCFGGILIQNSH